ncbi:hypothetical protein B0A48_08433 [Cryoendolithus antarcticus]|uniref:Dynactin subunit 5 n=1 Tax=Cryoendolithus antarcticus TaxID=1507870 RepID=A0A1V8T5E8_9PEZI|nr:hypothetical protein B0A48_08433 [Cryoendolithus antarcticus]
MSRSGPVSRRSVKTEYIETETGNRISRKARIEGKPHIQLGGKSMIMAGVILRGDLHRKPDPSGDDERKDKTVITAISIGRGCVISTGCVLRPPSRISKDQITFFPIRISDNVFIGPDTHISAGTIGANCHIGAGCVLSPFSYIRENCKILPGTVVPHSMTVPPGCVVGGRPARILGDVGDGWGHGGGGEGEEWIEGGDLKRLVKAIK